MTASTPPASRQLRWRYWLSASLSRRLTLGLAVALLVSAAIVVGLGLMAGQSALRRQQEDAAYRVAQLFEASLQNAMVKRDLEGMAEILKHLGQTHGVAQARLLSIEGEVRFDSQAGGPIGGARITSSGLVWRPSDGARPEKQRTPGVDLTLTPPVSAPQLCVGARCQDRLHWSADGAGNRLQIVHPILNQPRCGGCHGATSQYPVNGLLAVDFQPRSLARIARRSALLVAAAVLGALALFALMMWLTLRRQVTRPLAGLALAADRLAAGQLDARVPFTAHDELGRLAHAFNRMADRLGETVANLRRGRSFLQHLVDGMPDPVVVIGPDYRIRLANQAYAALLGYELPAVIGQPCHQISCGLAEPCPSTLVTCPVAEIRQRPRPVRSMLSLKRRDGGVVDVDIDAAPLAPDQAPATDIGTGLGISGGGSSLATNTDDGTPILQQKPVAAQAQNDGEMLVIEVIRPLERNLRFSQQQRLSTIGLLANGVAHEIHNPLASIRIALQASLRGLRSGKMAREELTGYLELVDHEIDRCVLTTQRMMQMSQTPTQTLHPVGVAQAIDDVLALLREECRVRGVEVGVQNVPPALRVMGDEAELRQVLVNLVHNALHAMPQGGRIDISGAPTDDGQWFALSVRDTGCGIAAEDLPLIFMPFFSHRGDGQRGTGLGLAISKATMDRFGGRIDAHSAPGRGSDFTLTLRCAPDTLADNREHAFRNPFEPG